MPYRAYSIASDTPVGPLRASIQFARSDAAKQHAVTGEHCYVSQIEVVWATSTIDEAITGQMWRESRG
jgi:hypothetical protein